MLKPSLGPAAVAAEGASRVEHPQPAVAKIAGGIRRFCHRDEGKEARPESQVGFGMPYEELDGVGRLPYQLLLLQQGGAVGLQRGATGGVLFLADLPVQAGNISVKDSAHFGAVGFDGREVSAPPLARGRWGRGRR